MAQSWRVVTGDEAWLPDGWESRWEDGIFMYVHTYTTPGLEYRRAAVITAVPSVLLIYKLVVRPFQAIRVVKLDPSNPDDPVLDESFTYRNGDWRPCPDYDVAPAGAD